MRGGWRNAKLRNMNGIVYRRKGGLQLSWSLSSASSSSTERSLVRMVREGLNKAPNRVSPANAESAISSSRPAKAPSNANPRTAAPTPPHTASPPSPDRLRCKTTARSAPAASNPRVTDAGPGPLSDKTAQPATPDAPRESTRPSSPETTRDGCAARAEALADLAVADPAP